MTTTLTRNSLTTNTGMSSVLPRDEHDLLNIKNSGLEGIFDTDSDRFDFLTAPTAVAAKLPQPVLFLIDGVNAHSVPDSQEINTGTYLQKTHAMELKTGDDIESTQVMYEQGGITRGLSISIENGVMTAGFWNKAEGNWGYKELSVEIEANKEYTTTLVLDGNDANTGSAQLYLNGELVDDIQTGVGRLYAHGDDIGVGRVAQTTLVNNERATGSKFKGEIEKVVQYNDVLDEGHFSYLQSTLAEDWLKPEPEGKTVIEFGSIELSHNSTAVNLTTNFREEDLVIFTTLASFNGSHMATPKIQNVENYENFPGSSFDIILQEADYLDGYHVTEQVNYMATYTGNFTLDDGTKVEVGTTTVDFADYMHGITFNTPFSERPIVLTQIQSSTDDGFKIVRQESVKTGKDGFDFKIESEGRELDPNDTAEVAWIAIEQGSGVNNGYNFTAESYGKSLTHEWSQIGDGFEFGDNGLSTKFFGAVSSYNGTDPVALRLDEDRAMAQEGQATDEEVIHTREDLDVLALTGDYDNNDTYVLTGMDTSPYWG